MKIPLIFDFLFFFKKKRRWIVRGCPLLGPLAFESWRAADYKEVDTDVANNTTDREGWVADGVRTRVTSRQGHCSNHPCFVPAGCFKYVLIGERVKNLQKKRSGAPGARDAGCPGRPACDGR